ncbi:MAG: hypothetical protein KDA74_03420, partial [Planctomycetaceae bacterium]|nr:hypothetical protein [Planctomycetaceae bacterium]
MPVRKNLWCCTATSIWFLLVVTLSAAEKAEPKQELSQAAADRLEKLPSQKGICVILGLPPEKQGSVLIEMIRNSEFQIFFQSDTATDVALVRQLAEQNGFLGNRIFAEHGPIQSLALASNLADVIIVEKTAEQQVSQTELLRVLRPQAIAYLSKQELKKPIPSGNDYWNHPYHRPDNNPQSTDQNARSPYRTQFLADPKFSPMPEVSVAAGGKVFKAFGHIAHKENQNAILNTLMCINAYNGTILWKRPLSEGFMIHRNTMI